MTPWHADGVRFECTGCGDCCRWPGIVPVSEAELDRLADDLGMSASEVRRRFTYAVPGGLALVEAEDGACIFLHENKCSVYESRPDQCRHYPFFPEVFESPDTWAQEARKCEGIAQGPLISETEILGRLQKAARVPSTKLPKWLLPALEK